MRGRRGKGRDTVRSVRPEINKESDITTPVRTPEGFGEIKKRRKKKERRKKEKPEEERE